MTHRNQYIYSAQNILIKLSLSFTEEELKKGNLLTVIQRMSTEWSLTFSVQFRSGGTIDTVWCNIIHLTHNGDHESHGDQIPVLFVRQDSGVVTQHRIVYDINSDRTSILLTESTTVGEWDHFEFHQRYVSGGICCFFVKRNGEEIKSIINTDARQWYNVKLYAGNP